MQSFEYLKASFEVFFQTKGKEEFEEEFERSGGEKGNDKGEIGEEEKEEKVFINEVFSSLAFFFDISNRILNEFR